MGIDPPTLLLPFPRLLLTLQQQKTLLNPDDSCFGCTLVVPGARDRRFESQREYSLQTTATAVEYDLIP